MTDAHETAFLIGAAKALRESAQRLRDRSGSPRNGAQLDELADEFEAQAASTQGREQTAEGVA